MAQVTGSPVVVSRISRTFASWAGFRVAKCPATAKLATCAAISSMPAASPASSSGACCRPSALCPPVICSTGSAPSAAASPARSITLSSKPIRISPTRPPTPSTTAFVARVVDRLMRLMRAAGPPQLSRQAAIAPPTPTDRSARVVSAFAVARTSPLVVSSSAASVKVPPVSSPKTRLMRPVLWRPARR